MFSAQQERTSPHLPACPQLVQQPPCAAKRRAAPRCLDRGHCLPQKELALLWQAPRLRGSCCAFARRPCITVAALCLCAQHEQRGCVVAVAGWWQLQRVCKLLYCCKVDPVACHQALPCQLLQQGLQWRGLAGPGCHCWRLAQQLAPHLAPLQPGDICSARVSSR